MISGARTLLSLALAGFAATAAAQALAPAELMRRLASVESAHATFVETRHSALLKEPLVLRGTLEYRRPASLEKHVRQPYDERMRIEGDVLTLENARGRKLRTSVSGSPGLAAVAEGIRATRAGELGALERHFAVRIEGSAGRWSISLTPTHDEVARYVAAIVISGSEARIVRIEWQEAGGDRAAMEIDEEIR